MLEALQDIIQAASNAADVDAALAVIVHGVREALEVDQCSIYLVDPSDGTLVLTATEGLAPESIGKVRLALGEGLVGTIGAQRRPLLVADAQHDPRNVYFPITGEERYGAFLGAPLLHLSELVGVIAVQASGAREFTEQEEAFAVTIAAQLAGIVHGAARQLTMRNGARPASRVPLRGVPAAPGIAVGVPVPPSEAADLDQVGDREVEDVEAEIVAFHQAVRDVIAEFRDNAERYRHVDSGAASELFDTYAEIARDPALARAVEARIRNRQWAAGALRDAVEELATRFADIKDERLRARAEDIRAVGRRILLLLHADTRENQDLPERCILIGPQVSIARMATIPREKLVGVVCEQDSVYSHTAIFARSLGIPAVMGVGPVGTTLAECSLIAVDGYAGLVVLEPRGAVLREYRDLEREEGQVAEEARRHAQRPARSRDGVTWSVGASISTPAEATTIAGADGVGLYRTEFSFMVRESFPPEDVQLEIYREVLTHCVDAPVVVRTLDAGGDKPLPYFTIAEANPALGTRGIRISLRHPDLFSIQIRALLRAQHEHSDLRILLPMVTTVQEVIEARALIAQAHEQLGSQGHAVAMPPVGVMIEVPALAYQMPALCAQADFVSIGTNDLTQYLLAMDRTNPAFTDAFDQLQPAVLCAVGDIISSAHEHHTQVTICGELASDPMGVLVALGMRSDGVSVPPRLIGRVKWVAGEFSRSEAESLYREARTLPSAQAVRERLAEALEQRGLGGLIRAGR